MSGSSVQYTRSLNDTYNDSTSMEVLIGPETQKKSKYCRTYVVGGIVVIVICAIVMFSVIISIMSNAREKPATNHKTAHGNITTITNKENIGNVKNSIIIKSSRYIGIKTYSLPYYV